MDESYYHHIHHSPADHPHLVTQLVSDLSSISVQDAFRDLGTLLPEGQMAQQMQTRFLESRDARDMPHVVIPFPSIIGNVLALYLEYSSYTVLVMY